ncbi:MAG: M55 family metallopeptidase [Lentisphaeria bacterium]|nr:M55 family metallopeptidase [Lentisphaeria bacterium]
MKIYLVTDMEGVAGVQNFADWTGPDARYYQRGRELLTLEVNAAVDGFCAAGATEILVVDGHGPGAVDIQLLDPRADFLRGWGPGPYPLCLDESFDAVAWVGQHAKSRTPYSHMTHTQGCAYYELTINGVALGEFGQVAYCAAELGVPLIFGSGEQAFTEEARELVPEIETVAVKRGLNPHSGDELTAEQYRVSTSSAIHTNPVRARECIRIGAERAVRRFLEEPFGKLEISPPYEKVITLRACEEYPYRRRSVAHHPDSVIEIMNANAPFERSE